jgi:hypothetical protein
MAVFISYQRADEARALAVTAYLKKTGIPCFFDLLEPGLTREKDADVTNIIRKGLANCSHLMAIISEATKLSWWVPFEIGAATETDKRISSFRIGFVDLPHYLEIWPVLSSDRDLDMFIRVYKKDSVVEQSLKAFSDSTLPAVKTATEFHRVLKTQLGLP